jgi:hypothetical protein
MKKIDVGQTLTIIGNLSVVAGILLLVFELNQNREMVMAQTRNEMSQGLIEILLEIGNDSEDAGIYIRGNRRDELSEIEAARYQLLTIAQLRYHENVFYQYRQGLYDESEYVGQREYWRNSVFSDPGLVEVFCEIRAGFSADFRTEIEGLLDAYQCR